MRNAADKGRYEVDILLVPAEEIERRVRRDYWRMVCGAVWRRLVAFPAMLLRLRGSYGRSGLGRT